MSNPVNIFWQSIATLFIPTGLYAFLKIDKLRKGVLVYLASFGVSIIAEVVSVLLYMTHDNSYNLLIAFYALGIVCISFILPIHYIRKWSIEYNKKIGKENITFSQAVRS